MENAIKILINVRSTVDLLESKMHILNRGKLLLSKEGPNPFLLLTMPFKTYGPQLSHEKLHRKPGIIVRKDGTIVRKKAAPVVQINLLRNSELTVLPLTAAENIAKANGMNLIKINKKVKSARETYKLVSDADLTKENCSDKVDKKNHFKTFIFSPGIFDHDFEIKTKSILKNLKKNKGIKCIIKEIGKPAETMRLFGKIIEELKKEGILDSMTIKNSTQSMTIEPRTKEDEWPPPNDNRAS